MANKIQFKRGTKANLPTLAIAEPGFTTDTKELFIGSAAGNIRVGGSNKNLLDNPDFQVNQRGQSSYSGSTYTVDRWRIYANGTVTINNGYITLAASGGNFEFLQYITKFSDLAGKTLTLSARSSDGTLFFRSGMVPTTKPSVWSNIINIITEFGFVQFNYDPSIDMFFVSIVVSNGHTVNIQATKLELGPISTLANDPPADYGEQLALCQRYGFGILGDAIRLRASEVTADMIVFYLPTPATMRITPTYTGAMALRSLAGVQQNGFTNFIVVISNHIAIVCTKASHGLSDAQLYMHDVFFSADL